MNSINYIRDDFTERMTESRIMLELINEVTNVRGNVNNVAILKSSFFLLLYNIIESTTWIVFEEIHEHIKHYKFKELSPKIRLVYTEYFFNSENTKKTCETIIKTIDGDLTTPNLETIVKKINLFSGNLDARSINKLLTKYGIKNINNKSMKSLVIIKNKRNKLAHGEESFKVSGRGFTTSELENFSTAVRESMFELFLSVDEYLISKKYLS